MNKWFLLVALLLAGRTYAQESLRVLRGNAISRDVPVLNIHVDEENNKWVSNRQGVFRLYGADLATPLKLADGEQSLLFYPDGNQELRWSTEKLRSLAGELFSENNRINAATFDARRKELWIGASQTGLYRLATEPELRLLEHFDTRNSKLKSDYINTIFIDPAGRQWIGTRDGVLFGENGRWKLLERYFDVRAIAGSGSQIWLMGEDMFGKMEKEVWYPIEIPARKTEGELRDIVFDYDGNLWIASEVVTRYNPSTKEYTVFGPAQEYTSQFATCLAVDLDGVIWVGTRDKGLFAIQKGSLLAAVCEVEKPVSCTGNGKDAALLVKASGGQGPYRYAWSGGLQGENPRGLGPGEYTVTVTDSQGQNQVAKATIADPRLTLQAAQTEPAGPGEAADGKATVAVTGGSPSFRFQWDNGETTAAAIRLSPGSHTVTVTDRAGCSATASVTIDQGLAELQVDVTITQFVDCHGEAQAGLKAVVSGGQAPYRYEWNDRRFSSAEPTGLAAGNYELTVTDAAGARRSIEFEITQPPALTAVATAEAPAGTGGANGQASIRATGGTAAYTYAWDNGETTAQAQRLAPGVHKVTVTDAAGCATTAEVTITENILPLAVTLSQTREIACNGGRSAALSAAVSGGKGPYTYQWSEGALSGAEPANLSAGIYRLTVTDATGATFNAETTIREPQALSATATAESPAGTGGSDGKASIRAAGGTAAYTYAWDNGETTAQAQRLAPGVHKVTVTDAAGCATTAEVTITEDILPLAVTVSQTKEIACNGGRGAALAAAVSGGKGPYTYRWSDADLSGSEPSNLAAGTYNVTITDASGQEKTAALAIKEPSALNASATADSPASTGNADGKATIRATGGTAAYTYAWDNGETAAQAQRLAPGLHKVTVTDAAGCATTAEVTITENILPLAVTLSQTREIACNGGRGAALSAAVSGGKGPYTYRWSDATLSGAEVANLSAGAYNVTITDASGQEKTATLAVKEPQALAATATADSPASTGNADGKATIRATGGTAAYTYVWDNGETTAQAQRLAPGVHKVTVTDAAGCATTTEVTITENILPLAVTLSQTKEIACNGARGAALSTTVSGGKGPYTYRWSDATLSGAEVANLSAGAYNVTITDASGQEKTATLAVKEPQALAATATADSPASTGNANGKATIRATGGTAAYTYVWDNGETTAQAQRLAPGVHKVTVTDAAGCATTTEVTITENILPLAVTLSQTKEIACNGARGAALSTTVSGGKGPYTYRWSDATLSGAEVANLSAGAYNVTITDASGQEKTATLAVKEPQALAATATADSPASTGNANGKATIRATGGTAAYTYAWDNGETTAQAQRLAPGLHKVTVTDAAGCTTTAEATITENILPLAVTLSQTKEIACNGGRGAALSAAVSGGKGPYTYRWSDATLDGSEPTNLPAGAYTVTITDASGQSKTATFAVKEPQALTATVSADSPASTGGSDGKASIRATGGTAGYTYAWDNGESTAQAQRLAPGVHKVTVTDVGGCTTTAEVTITENILPLAVTLSQTKEIACNSGRGAALSATVSGGKGPFTYTWSEASLSGAEPANLAAGSYTVTITDASGQSKTASLAVKEPAILTARIVDKKPTTAVDRKDGKAEVKAEGGAAPYQFKWDNEELTSSAQMLAVGEHTVTITDVNGCTTTASVSIKERAIPELTAGQLRSGQTIQMQKLQFEADSTRLTETDLPTLDELYQFLKENPSVVVEIGGHTNSLPPPEYCDQLSTARAKAVADYLVEKGIDGNRVYYKGYGKRQPIFSNQTEDGRRRNQRVEIKILRL